MVSSGFHIECLDFILLFLGPRDMLLFLGLCDTQGPEVHRGFSVSVLPALHWYFTFSLVVREPYDRFVAVSAPF